MATIFDHTGMTTVTTGTGTLTLGSALGAVAINAVAYQSFATAGVPNSGSVSYLILDSNGNWEVGVGTYTSVGTTLTRNVTASSNSNSAINLSGNAQVFITFRAEDYGYACSSGRLVLSSATLITFLPYNGDRIKIQGNWYSIPSTGTASANTSVYVNGVSGQNLADSTLYYVYLWINGGSLTWNFSTTGHATDSTAGNVGVEIMSGNNAYSLIGMVYTSASGQFQSDLVASWFNRRSVGNFASLGNLSTTSTSSTKLSSNSLNFLSWSDDATLCGASFIGYVSVSGQNGQGNVTDDQGVVVTTSGSAVFESTSIQGTLNPSTSYQAAEGFRSLFLYGQSSSGSSTATFLNAFLFVTVRN